MDLTPKQARFVSEYLIDLNGTQAAIRAGYSKATANEQASRLLASVSVSKAVQAGQKAKFARNELSADRVMEEYRRVGFIDHRTFFDAHGNLKPIAEWDEVQGAAVASTEIVIKNAAAGDGVTDRVLKLKTWDKMKALNDLAKHFGLLEDKVSISGKLEIEWNDGSGD